MRISLLVVLLLSMISTAHAYICIGDTHYSDNYILQITCEYDRTKDYTAGKTRSPMCYQGLISPYYFYFDIKSKLIIYPFG